MDCINFGVILYFMVGLAPGAGYFFTFMGIVFLFNILMNEFLFLFATFATSKASVQVAAACLVFFFMLFAGFIIAPNTIPSYYEWIYWYSPMTWAYRALVVNEFTSNKYPTEVGQLNLQNLGFVDDRGETFDREWITWAFIYMLGHILLTIVASALILNNVRVSGQSPPVIEKDNDQNTSQGSNANAAATAGGAETVQDVDVPFKPVTLSFENVCYDVKASTSNEDLRLLNNVNGFFKAGRMCALMGESGAGKTTLMDLVALRKNTGTVTGEILVNGFPQEKTAFRRCSGYVEQFDVQSPQLTVRETVLFSARLRLDSEKVPTDDAKQRFCDKVLKTLELTPLADSLVGSDEEGGLSFEQRKRLSIAVELAASPSILFLDEVRQTLSCLLIPMKGMRDHVSNLIGPIGVFCCLKHIHSQQRVLMVGVPVW
jgi:ABC-type lipoprotein export system ATPase subunit